MGELGETLASLFQGFDVFGAKFCHWGLDIVKSSLSQLSTMLQVMLETFFKADVKIARSFRTARQST